MNKKRWNNILGNENEARSITELHVHLGGSVPLYRLWEMGIAKGVRGVGSTYEDFISRLQRTPSTTGDLDRYLEVFDIVELIQSGPQAVAECIRIAINGAYRTGGMRRLGPGGEGGDPNPMFAIKQLELRFNPMKRSGVLLSREGNESLYDVDRIIRAACESAEESEIAYRGAIKTGLIFCFGRDLAWEVNETLAEKVNHWSTLHNNIIGIDMAGPESSRDLSCADDLARVKALYDATGSNMKRTIHLGETRATTAEIFINTIEAINPDRVAHPIAACRALWENNDSRPLDLLAERQITLELCIQSNLLTQAVKSVEEYKYLLETFDKFNIPYTFSTDSPALQLTTLAGEIDFLLDHNAIIPEQVVKAFKNANQATFLRSSTEAN